MTAPIIKYSILSRNEKNTIQYYATYNDCMWTTKRSFKNETEMHNFMKSFDSFSKENYVCTENKIFLNNIMETCLEFNKFEETIDEDIFEIRNELYNQKLNNLLALDDLHIRYRDLVLFAAMIGTIAFLGVFIIGGKLNTLSNTVSNYDSQLNKIEKYLGNDYTKYETLSAKIYTRDGAVDYIWNNETIYDKMISYDDNFRVIVTTLGALRSDLQFEIETINKINKKQEITEILFILVAFTILWCSIVKLFFVIWNFIKPIVNRCIDIVTKISAL